MRGRSSASSNTRNNRSEKQLRVSGGHRRCARTARRRPERLGPRVREPRTSTRKGPSSPAAQHDECCSGRSSVRIVAATAQPASFLVHASVTNAVWQNPCQVWTHVMSATRNRFGAAARKVIGHCNGGMGRHVARFPAAAFDGDEHRPVAPNLYPEFRIANTSSTPGLSSRNDRRFHLEARFGSRIRAFVVQGWRRQRRWSLDT